MENKGINTDVLIFGSMGSIGQEATKLLVREGLAVATVPFLQNVFRDEPGYRRSLVQAISEFKPEFVFPVGNPLAMSRFKGLVEQGVPLGKILNRKHTDSLTEEAVRNVRIAVEKEAVIRLLDSKVQCYALAKELGIPQPQVFGSPDEIPEGMKTVFKRDVSFGGHGVHLPKDIGALERLIAHQSPGEAFLIEEFIDGQDYSLDAVRNSDGSIASGGYVCIPAKVQAERLHEDLGPAVVRKPLDRDDSLLAKMRTCATSILEHLDYHGICGFDFRADVSGNIYLLECNPRFTGGISVQASAGLNLPLTLYLQQLGSGHAGSFVPFLLNHQPI